MQLKQKKIMFVVPALTGGGAEKVASTLLELLAKSDEDLKIFLILLHRERVDIRQPNVDIICLDLQDTGNTVHAFFKFFRLIYHLAKIIRQVQPATIISFMDYLNVVCIMSNFLSGSRSRVVLTVHTLLVSYMQTYAEGYQEKILRRLALLTYGKADAVIAVSRGVRDDLVKIFRIEAARVHIIPNPVDIKKIQALSREEVDEAAFSGNLPVILSAGRLSKEKGFANLISSFSGLTKIGHTRLVVLGAGKEEENLKKLSRELGVSDDVFFLGYKDNPYKYMKHATVLVVPSLYEGFGMVIVEAMACGLPVIATRSYEGIEDIVENEKNGLLVPVADVPALAGAMERLLQDEPLRNALAQEAALRLKKYRIDDIASEYRKVLFSGTAPQEAS
jgi:glycosyltransferase involved in cell wall biosynthesis